MGLDVTGRLILGISLLREELFHNSEETVFMCKRGHVQTGKFCSECGGVIEGKTHRLEPSPLLGRYLERRNLLCAGKPPLVLPREEEAFYGFLGELAEGTGTLPGIHCVDAAIATGREGLNFVFGRLLRSTGSHRDFSRFYQVQMVTLKDAYVQAAPIVQAAQELELPNRAMSLFLTQEISY